MTLRDALILYERLAATLPGVEVDEDAAIPCTRVNGHVFSHLTKDNRLALLVPNALDRRAFHIDSRARRHPIRPDFVVISDSLFADTLTLQPYFEAAYVHAASRKPKT